MTNYSKSKGTLKEHIPCPYDNCGSSDAMAVYVQEDGSEDGTCYSCGQYSRDPYGASDPTRVTSITRSHGTLQAGTNSAPQGSFGTISLEDGLTHPVRAIRDRGIDHATAEHFNVRIGVSSTDGETPIYHLYPRYRDGDQVGWKKKTQDKQFMSTGGQDVDLFGLHLCKDGGKKIWITEGELDAMSVYQALTQDSSIKWSPDVVSLPDGCQSATKAIANNLEQLSKFDEIVLVFDNDVAGKEATKVICKMLAGKVSHVTLPLKDANEMVMDGRTTDLKWQCLSHAKKYQPDGIINAKDMWSRYKESKDSPFYPYPPELPILNSKVYGARPGSIITVTSGTGMGKTRVLKRWLQHFKETTDEKIAGMFLEEDITETVEDLISIETGKRIGLPDVNISDEEETAAFENLFNGGQISLYDFFGGMDDDSLLSKLKYFAVTGHKFIFLDHLSIIVSEYAVEGDERKRIDSLMTKLAKFVKEFGIVLILVVHLKKSESSSKSFEMGTRPTLDDLRGSSTLKQLSWDVFALARNQQHHNPRTANTTEVIVLKCRKTGRTGVADYLEYDDVTGLMKTVEKPQDWNEKEGTKSRPVGSNEY